MRGTQYICMPDTCLIVHAIQIPTSSNCKYLKARTLHSQVCWSIEGWMLFPRIRRHPYMKSGWRNQHNCNLNILPRKGIGLAWLARIEPVVTGTGSCQTTCVCILVSREFLPESTGSYSMMSKSCLIMSLNLVQYLPVYQVQHNFLC